MQPMPRSSPKNTDQTSMQQSFFQRFSWQSEQPEMDSNNHTVDLSLYFYFSASWIWILGTTKDSNSLSVASSRHHSAKKNVHTVLISIKKPQNILLLHQMSRVHTRLSSQFLCRSLSPPAEKKSSQNSKRCGSLLCRCDMGKLYLGRLLELLCLPMRSLILLFTVTARILQSRIHTVLAVREIIIIILFLSRLVVEHEDLNKKQIQAKRNMWTVCRCVFPKMLSNNN